MADPSAPLLITQGGSVQFPGTNAPSLTWPAMTIAPGERVLIAGPTGCGKTTFWSLLAGLLPTSHVTGAATTLLLGTSLPQLVPAVHGRVLGALFQTPADQLLATSCSEEIALGLRPLGLTELAIRHRAAEALSQVGLQGLSDQPPALLSGGEQQRLCLAAAIARQPAWLLLDEPFSQLDPQGARALAECLRRITTELQCGIVLTEHRLALASRCADRLLWLESGDIRADGPVTALLSQLPRPAFRPRAVAPSSAARRVQARQLEVQFVDQPRPALQLDTTLSLDGLTVLLGTNGSGKSTLLALLSGEQRPTRGTLRWHDSSRPRVALVPQQTDFRLLGGTIAQDLALTGAPKRAISEVAAALRLPDLGLPPLAMSRGERLRIALAGALLEQPDLLLLDEPTTGQDADALQRLLEILQSLTIPIVLATHDLDFARAAADQVWLLRAGTLIATGPADLLSDVALLEDVGLQEPDDG
ncbi:MAG: putative HMP/thiamine import ATP-binding protein YkoD [bacterium]|nr:putative HMP/thiamine import ATP-binding protein YkoD [bacterium]